MTAATIGSKLFRERLQPELDTADKDKRAQRAYEYVLEAIAAGNDDKAQRAFDLMLQRWQEREALTPAPPWLCSRRFDQMDAILAAVELDAPMLDAVYAAWYYVSARANGEGEQLARAWSRQRMANQAALAAGQGQLFTRTEATA